MLWFENASCNSFHTKLFQCVDVHNSGTGIYNCDEEFVAGVFCPDHEIPISNSPASVVLTSHVMVGKQTILFHE